MKSHLKYKFIGIALASIVVVLMGIWNVFTSLSSEGEKSNSNSEELNINPKDERNPYSLKPFGSYRPCGDIKEIKVNEEGLYVPCPEKLAYKIIDADKTEMPDDADMVIFIAADMVDGEYSNHYPDLNIHLDVGSYTSPDDLYTWFARQGVEIKEKPLLCSDLPDDPRCEGVYPGCPPGSSSEGCSGSLPKGSYDYAEDREKNIITYYSSGGHRGSDVIVTSVKKGDRYYVVEMSAQYELKIDDKPASDIFLRDMHY